jgi:phage terminase large subunit-like protein
MDEMHSWKQKQGADLYEAVFTSGGARTSPLNLIITTADFSRDSMCNDKFQHAQNVCKWHKGLKGLKGDDSTFLPVLYYLDKGDDWTKEENWYKCNPNLGVSVDIDYYRTDIKKAQSDPTYTNSFKRLYMNIQTQSENKFLDFMKWEASEMPADMDLTGQDCYGGLDLAFKSDLCCFVLEFPIEDKYYIKTLMWIPEEHPQINFYKNRGWLDNGDIKTTPGNGIDFKQVREDIVKFCKPYNPLEIGYDNRFATELVQTLYSDHDLPMIEVNQSPRYLSEPLKDIAVSILDDKFLHDGNKAASWQLGNASSKELDGGLIKLVKPTGKDTTLAKVDFVAALSMAHFRVIANEEDIGALLDSDDYSIF